MINVRLREVRRGSSYSGDVKRLRQCGREGTTVRYKAILRSDTAAHSSVQQNVRFAMPAVALYDFLSVILSVSPCGNRSRCNFNINYQYLRMLLKILMQCC
ncbi:hypothetical protein SY86_14825 [Erwinia tracheiphila]|uniref:Uncharacterized protein n=1 Tax=Erwinia tracheiphila TaxID=65700 RepID=A0A0M2KGH9_9GAMM|nr:hypothetical protein ETR_21432 [Erwinia tracheiphila PSU-1]KKF36427.1 hypothetical protein SY86_14825 [Erwinia tracheiphila]